MSFLGKNGAYGSSKQNVHVCINIQGDNGVPLNYNRFRQQTGQKPGYLLFSVRLVRLHGHVKCMIVYF